MFLSSGWLAADDDLGIHPLIVKLLGGPGMQVREEQLRQTNDANIPGFEGLAHRFACGLPHDGRISTGWPILSYVSDISTARTDSEHSWSTFT